MRGALGSIKKKNRKTALTKNYPKPKDRDRFRSKPKTAYKTIKTEDLRSSIQFTKPWSRSQTSVICAHDHSRC